MLRNLFLASLLLIALNSTMAITLKPVTVKTVATNDIHDNKITLYAVPWNRFSRGLVRFDLTKLQAQNFKEIARAELSFSLVVKDNSFDLPLKIASINTAWDDSVNWSSPINDEKWPRNKHGYAGIDRGADWDDAYTVSAAQSGTVSLNISRFITQNCFEGRKNWGLMFRIGPETWGRPDAKPFEVEISNLVLEVSLVGQPPTPAELDSITVRRFPSALLPPISNPYVFHIFNGKDPDYPDNIINSLDVRFKGPENGYLAQRWFFGPQNPYYKSEDRFINAYTNAANTHLAIHVDEWQGYKRVGKEIGEEEDPNRAKNDKITWSINGIRKAKKLNPDFMINVYWRGEDSIEPLVEDGLPDMLIIEAQSHLRRQFPPSIAIEITPALERAKYAKKLGMIERTIMLIGFFENPEDYHEGLELTPEKIERKIKMIRNQFPEMPGLAFYGSGKSSNAGTPAAELLRYAENLCFDIYIAPAPSIRIISPKYESTINSSLMEVVVKAEAKEDCTIQRYDWFVDNRLMAQTQSSHWFWDTRYWSDGLHIITVHAIDSNWNRAAAQVPIKLKR